MIMAPITVAVEPSTTPSVAITAERKRRAENRTRYRYALSSSKKSLLSKSVRSAGVNLLFFSIVNKLVMRFTCCSVCRQNLLDRLPSDLGDGLAHHGWFLLVIIMHLSSHGLPVSFASFSLFQYVRSTYLPDNPTAHWRYNTGRYHCTAEEIKKTAQGGVWNGVI